MIPIDPHPFKLCSVSPVVVEQIPNMTGHEVLSHYRRTPHSIVIDSHRPDIAPHIVITPPDSWDVFTATESNRINYQNLCNLPVPPFYLSTCRMPTYQEWMSMCYPPPPQEYNVASSSAPALIPGAPVFNRISFQSLCDRAADERLYHFTRDLHFVNHRRLYKVAAIAASLRGQEFRIRHDYSRKCLATFEKPYRWTDPADPILSALGRCCDTHIIHSVNSFLAPHIVIQECGPNDPWTRWNNATDYQDLAFGNSLGVISSNRAPLTYLNVPDESDTDETIDMAWEDEDCLSSGCSSYPQTPSTLDGLSDGFLFEEDITECPTYLGFSESASVVQEEASLPRSKATFFLLDEDEDDGPPEFDEWYISIAARTHAVEEAGRNANGAMVHHF
ncbi:hypothetical protein CPB84DRAFT_67947 [Gymnopilus junonius]|uniref:Uncharacterized protein n=1 Tax=Gymnopilus junonius TaxID=109634 RepID=A0A9P5TVA5_GYMJU|nr:hypothetical protein CPB84DRAFT_67947 [Gymnopilus junonius]